MVQAAEERLQQGAWSNPHLLVRETNTDAVSFYEHPGFETAPRTIMGKWLRNRPKSAIH
jgi:hypothetical protein